MTKKEFDKKFSNMELYEQYAEFIMKHAAGDRVICNGHTLICAMEDNYLLENFESSLVTED